MSKQVVHEETGWEVFGKIVATLGGIVGGVFLLYLLFVAPFERHREVIIKLEKVETKGEIIDQRLYMLQLQREK